MPPGWRAALEYALRTASHRRACASSVRSAPSMTILALQLASPIIRVVDIGGADNPGSRSDEARRDGLLARESLLAQALELGLDVLRAALRADAVGELRLGV